MKIHALASALILTAGPALAHPGHAAAVHDGVLHWLTETDHSLLALATLAAVLLVRAVFRRANRG